MFNMCGKRSSSRPKENLNDSHDSPLNENVQDDFLYIKIHGKRREILNIMDLGTKYGDGMLEKSRSEDKMK